MFKWLKKTPLCPPHDLEYVSDNSFDSFDAMKQIAGFVEPVNKIKEAYWEKRKKADDFWRAVRERARSEGRSVCFHSHWPSIPDIVTQWKAPDGIKIIFRWELKNHLSQQVCLRCGKCVDNVREEAERMLKYLNKRHKEYHTEREREALAKKLWKENNCGK